MKMSVFSVPLFMACFSFDIPSGMHYSNGLKTSIQQGQDFSSSFVMLHVLLLLA